MDRIEKVTEVLVEQGYQIWPDLEKSVEFSQGHLDSYSDLRPYMKDALGDHTYHITMRPDFGLTFTPSEAEFEAALQKALARLFG